MNSVFLDRGSPQRFSFFGLLISFFIFFLLDPLFPGTFGTMVIHITFGVMLLFSVFTLSENKAVMFTGLFIAMISIIANTYVLYVDTFWTEFFSLVTSLLFFTFTTVFLFRSVFLSQVIEKNMIFGAICIYILLAILWALLYEVIELIAPGSFLNLGGARLTGTTLASKLHTFLYYSFVTQTTLGYGDIIPVKPIAKNFAALQATMGVFYLATLVSGLINVFIAREKLVSKV